MPHVTIAMERSVRRGVVDILRDSWLAKRADTSSSDSGAIGLWNKCMANEICHWPVIAGVIVVGLIVLGVLWCLIRCVCCARSCCCSCFSFLKCCDCCGGCCDGKKNKSHKYLDDPYNNPSEGYKAPPPMMGGALASGPPQYAQFEVGKNGLAIDPSSKLNEDALPPMPSWETAAKKHVVSEEERNAVELGELDPVTGQKVPLMAGGVAHGISTPTSPANEGRASPYHQLPGQGNGNGYMNGAQPYSQNHDANYDQNGNGYRDGPGQAMGGQGYGPSSPRDPYGNDRAFNNTPVGGYGRPPPQRQFSNDSYRQYPPQRPMPQQQYSDNSYDNNYQNAPPRGPSRGPDPRNMIGSPYSNQNTGFEFNNNQQYSSRPSPPPQQQSYDSSYGGNTRSPPPQHPSYKPYQPPQNWDPVQR